MQLSQFGIYSLFVGYAGVGGGGEGGWVCGVGWGGTGGGLAGVGGGGEGAGVVGAVEIVDIVMMMAMIGAIIKIKAESFLMNLYHQSRPITI